MYLLCKSRVFTGDLAACNLKLQRNKLELPSGGHCYKLQPKHLSTSATSRQPVSARRMSAGEAVIAVGRGSEELTLGMC